MVRRRSRTAPFDSSCKIRRWIGSPRASAFLRLPAHARTMVRVAPRMAISGFELPHVSIRARCAVSRLAEVIAGSTSFGESGRLVLFHRGHRLNEGDALWEIPGVTGEISSAGTCLEISVVRVPWPRLAIANEKTITLWNSRTGLWLKTIPLNDDSAHACAFSSDGRMAAVCYRGGRTEVWDLDSSRRHREFEAQGMPVLAVAISNDSTQVATGYTDGTVRLWCSSQSVCSRILRLHASSVSALSFSEDGCAVISGSADDTAKVCNTSTGVCKAILESRSGIVLSVALSRGGNTAVTGSFDGLVQHWRVEDGQCLNVFRIGENCGAVLSLFILPDGRQALAGYFHGAAVLWDLMSGHALATFEGHQEQVRAVAMSPDGRMAITGAADGASRMWKRANEGKTSPVSESQAQTWHAVQSLPTPPVNVAAAFDGMVEDHRNLLDSRVLSVAILP